MKKHKQRWIKKVFKLLCKYQGAPENEREEVNMRHWAKILADDETAFFRDGFTPEDAVREELSSA